jgi:hypothetical protein
VSDVAHGPLVFGCMYEAEIAYIDMKCKFKFGFDPMIEFDSYIVRFTTC